GDRRRGFARDEVDLELPAQAVTCPVAVLQIIKIADVAVYGAEARPQANVTIFAGGTRKQHHRLVGSVVPIDQVHGDVEVTIVVGAEQPAAAGAVRLGKAVGRHVHAAAL